MGRVYISSTSVDLQAERRAARDAILRLYHQAAGMEFYGASEERPLEVCIDDVKRCDAYVGIIAWRYGFCPDGGRKSITEMEYEAAGEAGIPRLLYLSPQRDAWRGLADDDLAAVKDFRRRLGERHTVKFFSDVDDLEKQVLADLPRYVTAAQGACDLSLLPYLCDRHAQRDQLQVAMTQCETRIPICALHGPVDELPEKFLDCLKARLLSEWLGADEPATEYKVRWPSERDPALFEQQLQRNLATAMCLPIATERSRIEAAIDGFRTPVLVTTSLSVDQWERGDDVLLSRFADFFGCWRAARGPTLVVLWASYPPPESGLAAFLSGRRHRRSLALREALGRLEQSFGARERAEARALSMLAGITESDAVDWARSDPIQPFRGRRDLESEVRALFRESTLSMRALAPNLLQLLHSSHQR